MKCIDFDKYLGQYIEKYIIEHRDENLDIDEVEARMPEIYMRWLNTPADWLDGCAPGAWFQQYDDVDQLIEGIKEYHRARILPPDLLLERITAFGEAAAEGLMAVAADAKADVGTRITALNMLGDIGTACPMELCLEIISSAAEQDGLSETASELLINMGRRVVEPALARMEGASAIAREALLDVLCNFPGDERIYKYAMHAFRTQPERRALYASYLSKLRDPRAIEPLKRALTLTELNYLDYIEIVNAIEALGGEVEMTREFAGDPYYESLKKMD